jgi:hypothetical protein
MGGGRIGGLGLRRPARLSTYSWPAAGWAAAFTPFFGRSTGAGRRGNARPKLPLQGIAQNAKPCRRLRSGRPENEPAKSSARRTGSPGFTTGRQR